MTGTTRTRTTRRPATRAPMPLGVSDPGADPRVIRRRAGREGYVFCRALVPRDRIGALRHHALAVAADLGWLTVHKALPNASGRALRLSATCRYRAAGRGERGRRR